MIYMYIYLYPLIINLYLKVWLTLIHNMNEEFLFTLKWHIEKETGIAIFIYI